MSSTQRVTALTRLTATASAFVAALLSLGCQAASPAGGPEANCARTCAASSSRCSESQCSRGCNLILDRLAEREGGHVLACVAASAATSTGACDDRTWSRCATRVGPHADGGPPPPLPPHDVEDVTEGD